MSYRAGVGPGLEEILGPPGDPRITCDGCGKIHGVTKRSGQPYAWFLDGKPPPGWKTLRDVVGAEGRVRRRVDYCKSCLESGR